MTRQHREKKERRSCGDVTTQRKTEPATTTGATTLHPGKFRHILVPVDFSEPSLAAVRYAASLATESGAVLELVYVVERPSFIHDLDCFPLAMSETEVAGLAKQKLMALADSEIDEFATVKTETRVGKPAQEILTCAEHNGADLIIIAAHGRNGLGRITLGSTAEKVVRLGTCPVLVFHALKPAPELPLVLNNVITDE